MIRLFVFSMTAATMILALLIPTSAQSSGRGTLCSDPSMVKVGPICVDIYEASVWSSPAGGKQYGVGARNYPCNDNGNDCSDPSQPTHMIFVSSVPEVIPSTYVTWFQAQQACANVGKRLLRNGEWGYGSRRDARPWDRQWNDGLQDRFSRSRGAHRLTFKLYLKLWRIRHGGKCK